MSKDKVLRDEGERMIVATHAMVKIMGLTPAVVLQQIHYHLWNQERLNGTEPTSASRVVVKRRQLLEDLPTVSERTLKYALAKLKLAGILVVKPAGNDGNVYGIDYERERAVRRGLVRLASSRAVSTVPSSCTH